MREAREGKITIPGVPEDVFSTLLFCIYGDKNVLTEDNLFDVWSTAGMYRMRSISALCVAKCKEIFDTKLSTKNCVDFLTNVRLLDEPAKQRALDFVGNHFTDLDKIHRLQLLKVDELKSLLTMKGLNVHSLDEVIANVLLWIAGNQHSKSAEKDSSDPEIANSSVESGSVSALDLADLLECMRYLLINEACLHGTLAIHPLVKSDPRCRSIVEKISYYRTHPHLHQYWCPPAAVHREHSDVTNVLLLCQLTNYGHLLALDLRDMTWKQIRLESVQTYRNSDPKVLCYKSEIYVKCNEHLNKHFPYFEKIRSVPFSQGITRIVCDSLYMYKINVIRDTDGEEVTGMLTYKLFNFQARFNSHLKERSRFIREERIDGMKIVDVIHIGLTEIIFFVKSGDCYTVLTCNDICNQYRKFPNQLGSSSRLVSFRHDREAFALQENGCLWRIQLGENLMEIKTTQELVLWDGEISLNGAVLYDDQLMIVGDFRDQLEISTTLDRSLPGVFQSIRKIRRDNDVRCPEISLAELPKTILK